MIRLVEIRRRLVVNKGGLGISRSRAYLEIQAGGVLFLASA